MSTMVATRPRLEQGTTALQVTELVKEFNLSGLPWPGQRKTVLRAVGGVSFDVPQGTTLGLVGESGCGKSTTARLVAKLLPATSGRVLFQGEDILAASGARMRSVRQSIQMVFQDPFSSLNPRKRVADILDRPLVLHSGLSKRQRLERSVELLETVGLNGDHMVRFSHEMSGGQCQRVAIARALAPGPALLIADEPLSALDVSIQAQILNLLVSLKSQRQFSMIFISHDLRAVEYAADEVAVMYAGRIVEQGPAVETFNDPLHPYTQMLRAAIPEANPRADRPAIRMQGEPFTPINPPPGCCFASRCALATSECHQSQPPLEVKIPGRTAACFKV